jgi:lipoprotein-anchoring transpeptidase ErfK/SrfK
MNRVFLVRIGIVCMLLLALGGCISGKKKAKPAPATPRPDVPSYWKGEGASGPPKIVIALGEQRAYFYRGGKVVGEAKISSGRSGFETPPGTYHVIQKDKDHVSNLYGDFIDEFSGEVVKSNVDISKENPPDGTLFRGAKMPYFLRFQSGYGLHAGRLPGRRASHGCVRLPASMAEHFFNNSEVGTPVVVED